MIRRSPTTKRRVTPSANPPYGPADMVVDPFRAHRRLMRRNKLKLFDHLVGAGDERRRHSEAERLGGLEVDHELELRGLFYG